MENEIAKKAPDVALIGVNAEGTACLICDKDMVKEEDTKDLTLFIVPTSIAKDAFNTSIDIGKFTDTYGQYTLPRYRTIVFRLPDPLNPPEDLAKYINGALIEPVNGVSAVYSSWGHLGKEFDKIEKELNTLKEESSYVDDFDDQGPEEETPGCPKEALINSLHQKITIGGMSAPEILDELFRSEGLM